MERETFGQRLKRFRLGAGLSQRKLALKSGLSNGAISQAESDTLWVGQDPSIDVVRRLARALEITIDQLSPDSDAPAHDTEDVPEIQTVPLAELLRRINARPAYGQRADDLKASAGKRSKAKVPQGYDDSRLRKRIGGDLPERIQLVEVEGECMVKALYPGDIVLVDTQQTPEIGKIVAAVRFYDEVIVKFLREKDDHQYFESMDKKVVIPLDQYTRILGPVVDVQRGIERILAEL
jgi:transcriptional regulator with XRE-family HTH domain